MNASSRQRPTMADVAAKAGVSRAAVSIVFRNQPGARQEPRERVLRAADEIGYRPDNAARLLARGRSRTIGVMIAVHQPFHATPFMWPARRAGHMKNGEQSRPAPSRESGRGPSTVPVGRAVPLGQARADGPHQLRTELARRIRDRAAAFLPPTTRAAAPRIAPPAVRGPAAPS